MTEYSFKNDHDSIKLVIEQLSHNPKLNDWEKGFIKTMQGYDLPQWASPKQLQILSDMWEKY